MKKIELTDFPDFEGKRKLLLIMKLTIIFLLTGFMQVSATVYSQSTKFDFDVKNKRIEDVLRAIEQRSDFRFFYQREQVNVEKRIDLNVENQPVEVILPQLFNGQNVVFDVREDNLILIKPESAAKITENIFAEQQRTVSGTVTDEDGVPLPGVSVVVQGTTRGTVTSDEGEYSISNVSEDDVLVFSFVGMTTQQVTIGNQSTINVQMRSGAIGIEEVVAIGYGTVKKSDLTGSVASVNSERLLDKPAFNVAQAISGKVAGVKIVERSGAPGGEPLIRIRGTNSINSNNSPLVVVDGIVGVANALNILNPNEIQSIEVLKDASATAIYGARGANGVILITTKRGVAGEIQVEYDGYVSFGFLQKHLESLNAEQFLYVYQQAWRNITKYAKNPNWPLLVDGSMLPPGEGGDTYSEYPYLFEQTSAGGYTVPLIGRDGNYYKPRFDTDWESAIFRPSTSTNHQLNIRGGSETAKIGAFLGYALEEGLLLNSSFNRFSGRITGDFNVAKWLDINSQIAVNKNREFANDVSYFSGGISRGVVEAFPIIPLQFPDNPDVYGEFAGRYGENRFFPVGEVDAQSPYLVSKTVERFTERSQFTGNLTFNFKITPDLTFKANFAVDDNSSKFNEYGGYNR